MTPRSEGAELVLLTPADWWRIPLHPAQERQRSVKALVDKQFGRVDHQPLLRRDALRQLGQQAHEAASIGGVQLYVGSTMAGLPVPATLTVVRLPMPVPDSAAEMRERLEDQDSDIDVVELAAGQAIRRRSSRPGENTGYEDAPTTTQVDYWIPAPDRGGCMQLAFSTPLEQIADTMVELFDAVASSVRWRTP